MRCRRALALLLAAGMLCSGCSTGAISSNYRPVEDLELIQTIGVDRAPEGVCLSAATGKAGEGEAPKRMTQSGVSMLAALDQLQDRTPSAELFYAQTSYLLLGEEAAAAGGLAPLLDFIARDPDMRLSAPLFIVRGGTAQQAVMETGDDKTDVTEALVALEKDIALDGTSHACSCTDIARALAGSGCAVVGAVTCVRTPEDEGGKLALAPAGYAIFRDGDYVGSIEPETARGASMLLGAGLSGRAQRGARRPRDRLGGGRDRRITGAGCGLSRRGAGARHRQRAQMGRHPRRLAGRLAGRAGARDGQRRRGPDIRPARRHRHIGRRNMTGLQLTRRQYYALCTMVLLSPLLHLVPRKTAAEAGCGGWLSGAAALVPLLLFAALLEGILRRGRPGEGIGEITLRALGPVAGRAALCLYALWFLLYGAFALRIGAERFIEAVFPLSQPWPFVVTILAMAVCGALGAPKALFRAAEIFWPLLAGVLMLVLVFALPGLDVKNLLPVTAADAPGVARSALTVLGAGAAVLFFAAFTGGATPETPYFFCMASSEARPSSALATASTFLSDSL